MIVSVIMYNRTKRTFGGCFRKYGHRLKLNYHSCEYLFSRIISQAEADERRTSLCRTVGLNTRPLRRKCAGIHKFKGRQNAS